MATFPFDINELKELIKQVRDKEQHMRIFETLVIITYFIILYLILIFFASTQCLFTTFFLESLIVSMSEFGISTEIAKNLLIILLLNFLLLLGRGLLVIKDKLVARRKYKWNLILGLEGWNSHGNITIDHIERAIHIINSELGCIIANRQWKNFEMKFLFKVPRIPKCSRPDEEENQLRRGFGVIYRARGLGQYYMLKVDASGYSPHVRNIYWENSGIIAKTSLTKSELDQWIPARIQVKDYTLTAEIGKDKLKFLIPSHSTVQREPTPPKSYSDKLESRPYAPIPFRDSGSVGFRSAPFEEVYIKDLEIREESTLEYIARRLKSFYSEHFRLRKEKVKD